MKYIRTKDGIILDRDKYLQDLDIEQYSMYMQGLLKETDNIEELCDEFVALLFDDETIYECPLGYYTEIFKARTHCLQSLIKNYDINMIGVRAIYGAIWTDKGLIYVAKMNEKGVLELLWTTN